MSDTPAAPDAWNELEGLLLACLERPDAERPAALEQLCTRHPQHAAALRQRFAMLSELGLVGASLQRALQVGEQFGDYRLLRRLGGGAMGVVYLAEQLSTRRRVALKVLRPELLDQPRARERFRRELAAAARLEHPGICTVYDAGEVDGRPFIAMRYLAGESLADAIERTRESSNGSTTVQLASGDGASDAALGERERIQAVVSLVEQAARALHTAHGQGLVHRDVKPGNILITEAGSPVLVDFGLVHDQITTDPTLTMSNDLLGTPAYMAPEQIEPQGRRIDPRTDVHALGAVLFECLTLHAPYEAPSREALYRQILTAEPPDPRHRNGSVLLDLAVVTQKALEKDPARRYQSALAFADDLCRVRTHEPVLARPASRGLRLRRWAQRNPLLAGALAAAFLCLGGGFAVSLTLLLQVRRTLAERQAGDVAALSTQALAHDTTLATLYALEAVRLQPENPTTASALYAAVAELREERVQYVRSPYCVAGPADGSYSVVGSDATAQSWVFREGSEPVELQTLVQGHALLHRVVVSKRGDRILVLSVGDQRMPAGGGLVTVWSPDRPDQPIARLPYPGEVLTACFTADGRFVTGCKDGIARLWSDGALLHELKGHEGPVYSCAASPDGELVVTGGQDCTVRRWDTGTGSQLGEPIAHGGWVVAIDFAPSSKNCPDRFVTATGYDSMRCWRGDPGFADDRARIFDRQGHLLAELGQHDNRIESARFSPDGRHVLTAGADYRAQLWRVEDDGTASRVAILGHDGVIYGSCFDATGERIATVTFSGTAYLWDLTGRRLAVLRGHRVCGTGCLFQGSRLVTTALDDTVRTWSVDSPFVASWSHVDLRCVTCARGGEWIVVAEHRGIVHVLERSKPRSSVVTQFDTGILNMTCIHCTPDGNKIAIGDDDGQLHFFDLAGVPVRPPIQAHAGSIKHVWFAPADAELVLSGSFDGKIRLWDLRRPTDEPAAEVVPSPTPPETVGWALSPHGSPVWSTAFSPDGRWFAGAPDDYPNYTVRLWQVDAVLGKHNVAGVDAFVLGKHDSQVRSLAFAQNGELLVCATLHGEVSLWNVASRTGGRIAQLERDVSGIAISPDGATIACGLMNGTVHLMQPDGSPRYVLPAQHGRIKSLHFLEHGSRLLVGVRPDLVSEWPAEPGALAKDVQLRLARSLTADECRTLDALLGR